MIGCRYAGEVATRYAVSVQMTGVGLKHFLSPWVIIYLYGILFFVLQSTEAQTLAQSFWNSARENSLQTLTCSTCNLRLNPLLRATARSKPAQCRMFANSKCLFFDDLAQQPDDFWTAEAIKQSHQMYPMDVDVVSIVQRIKQGQPVDQVNQAV